MKLKLTLAGMTIAAATVTAAVAAYPEKPITVLLPFTAGGGTDTAARTYFPYVERCLGNNARIVIQNMPGAGGELGFAALAKAAPDGYTIGFVNMPNMASGSIIKEAPWSIDSFTYLGNIIGSKVTLNVPVSSPVKTVDDLIALAQQKGKLTISISGIGGDDHLNALRFAKATGVDFNFAPFGDGASSRAALMGGHVDVGSMSNSEAANYQDKLRTLAVMAPERSPFLPDVPTFRELGYDLVGGSTQAIGAPAGIPQEAAKKLADCLQSAAHDPAFLEEAKTRALPLDVMTAEQLEQFVRAEHKALSELWVSDPWIAK